MSRLRLVQRHREADLAVLFLMVLPNLVWILLDRGHWVSDTALYGLGATRLHHALVHDAGRWWTEMIAFGPKPPILPWIGQFFVTFGRLIGNVDIELLLVNFGAQYVGLLLIYRGLTRFLQSRSIAIVGCLIAASAPLLIQVSTHFYVQPLQFTAVCWFFYIMASSRTWDSLFTLMHLIAASAFAMLIMMSSPVFCLGPGLVALVYAWINRRTKIRLRLVHGALALLALAFSTGAFAWYGKNLDAALEYARWGHSYGYGAEVRNVFWLKLGQWSVYVRDGFMVSALVALLAVWAFVLRSRQRHHRMFVPAVVVLLMALQIVLVLCILATSTQQTYRYVMPLLVFFAAIGSWALYEINNRWLTATVVGALTVQLVLANIALFNWQGSWREQRRQTYVDVANLITDMTSADSASTVWLGTGKLGVYSLDVDYHASKRAGYFTKKRPFYNSIEFALISADGDGDVDKIWRQMISSDQPLVVLVRDASRSKEDSLVTGWDDVLNATVEISDRVRSSTGFERLSTPEAWVIEVYRGIEGT
jgi:4-amino-4-deoxy-L-arabinose transferase-like glycosyltransferase